MEDIDRLKEHISERMKKYSEEKTRTGLYECCVRNVIDELLDIEILLNEITVGKEEAVVA